MTNPTWQKAGGMFQMSTFKTTHGKKKRKKKKTLPQRRDLLYLPKNSEPHFGPPNDIIIIAVHPFQPFPGDQMEDFSSELFSSFFDDHLAERPPLGERTSFLHMDIESNPGKLLSFMLPLRDVDVLRAVRLSLNGLRDATALFRRHIHWREIMRRPVTATAVRHANAVGFTQKHTARSLLSTKWIAGISPQLKVSLRKKVKCNWLSSGNSSIALWGRSIAASPLTQANSVCSRYSSISPTSASF